MPKDRESNNWSEWKPFPDPEKREYLYAPFGCGVYQLRNDKSGEFVLFGRGKRCAIRMSSLLPYPHGAGTRNNIAKRKYVHEHIKSISYRTIPLKEEVEMKLTEKKIKSLEKYIFKT